MRALLTLLALLPAAAAQGGFLGALGSNATSLFGGAAGMRPFLNNYSSALSMRHNRTSPFRRGGFFGRRNASAFFNTSGPMLGRGLRTADSGYGGGDSHFRGNSTGNRGLGLLRGPFGFPFFGFGQGIGQAQPVAAAAPSAVAAAPSTPLPAPPVATPAVTPRPASSPPPAGPPCAGSPLQVAERTPELSILVQALRAANLTGPPLSSRTTNLTLFAPTNAAFSALLGKLNVTSAALFSLANRQLLTSVLLYHVVPGVKIPSGSLFDGETLTTVQGGRLSVSITSSTVTIIGAGSRAKVVKADIPACFAVVHLVDSVLLPVQNPVLSG